MQNADRFPLSFLSPSPSFPLRACNLPRRERKGGSLFLPCSCPRLPLRRVMCVAQSLLKGSDEEEEAMHGISLTGEFSTSGYSLRRPRALLVPCTEALHNMSASFRLPSKKRGKGDNTATEKVQKRGKGREQPCRQSRFPFFAVLSRQVL